MMAQRKQLSWTELRVGVFVLVGLAVMALAIFYVTGGGTFSPKYRLTTYLPEVEGLQVGAPVSLSGLQVGNVESIALNKNPEDKVHNIAITMRIEKKFQDNIRTDSMASLVTQGLSRRSLRQHHRAESPALRCKMARRSPARKKKPSSKLSRAESNSRKISARWPMTSAKSSRM